MKKFTSELFKRKIVVISDYVDPEIYSAIELKDEIKFLADVEDQIKMHGLAYEYVEVKNQDELLATLAKHPVEQTVIFNWCEYLDGQEDTDRIVTKLLDDRGFVYTGADTACLELLTSKEETKKQLLAHGLLTPNYLVAASAENLDDRGLQYPLIAKLENRHASKGLSLANIVHNHEQLVVEVEKLLKKYDSRILVEELVDGQEHTVTVWGNGRTAKCIYFTKEVYLDPTVSTIYTEEGKFDFGSSEEKNLKSRCLDKLKYKKTIALLHDLVLNAYRLLKVDDYGRFDLREKDGKYYFLDCNPNPWIGIGSQLLKGSKKLGYNSGETVMKICDFALQRHMT
ncbi:hypothetical protein KJ605_03085 [Patescibacteria group bacterium]|nr:hypothetical protein [Patescibacteria group bacterium]MBU1970726.1 hypothetical protein [Patescibacteria group bacterium]